MDSDQDLASRRSTLAQRRAPLDAISQFGPIFKKEKTNMAKRDLCSDVFSGCLKTNLKIKCISKATEKGNGCVQ